MSSADVEGLLAERGIVVYRETIRLWVKHFGSHFADCIREDRPKPNDKSNLNKVVITINGVRYWLRRTIGANGDVLKFVNRQENESKVMGRSKSVRQAQRFPSAHDWTNIIIPSRRYKLFSRSSCHARSDAFALPADYAAE